VIALVGFGLGYFLFLTTSQSMLIIATPDHYRGRVMGLFAMSSVGAVPFAGLAGGAVAAALGPRTAVAIACGVILSYAVWFAVTERAVRRELSVDETSLVD
jgi:MFS family permease